MRKVQNTTSFTPFIQRAHAGFDNQDYVFFTEKKKNPIQDQASSFAVYL